MGPGPPDIRRPPLRLVLLKAGGANSPAMGRLWPRSHRVRGEVGWRQRRQLTHIGACHRGQARKQRGVTPIQAAQVLVEHGGEAGAHLINRMVFAQQVSALEAYLGDTLMRGVECDKDALQRLIETDKELLSEKVTLVEIAKNPELLKDRVKNHLRGVLYADHDRRIQARRDGSH